MSGNVILLKHAPGVPQCAVAFEQILREAGVPEGVYTNLFLINDQAGALIDDPRVKGIALTGSERAGEGSGRQGCESSKVKVLVPSIACIRTASISGACRGNEARSARM
jgi:succinate-semialdehyde dehydrogenase / glutarate-semialdehyde dehydrogenase